MLKRADYVVTYITHDWGGAAQFARKAAKQGKTVVKLPYPKASAWEEAFGHKKEVTLDDQLTLEIIEGYFMQLLGSIILRNLYFLQFWEFT